MSVELSSEEVRVLKAASQRRWSNGRNPDFPRGGRVTSLSQPYTVLESLADKGLLRRAGKWWFLRKGVGRVEAEAYRITDAGFAWLHEDFSRQHSGR